MPDLPQPERRKRATPKQVNELLRRQGGKCALCPAQLVVFGEPGEPTRVMLPFDVDHIQALAFLGSQTVDNLQCLCKPCHAAKTKIDNRLAKKGGRIRGETGNGFKRKIPASARGIQSPPFSRALRKRMDGTVVRRD